MRLTILLAGDDLFVQGDFASNYAAYHSRRLTEALPPRLLRAAKSLGEWANEQEPDLIAEVEKTRTIQELQRDIERMQKQLDAMRGN